MASDESHPTNRWIQEYLAPYRDLIFSPAAVADIAAFHDLVIATRDAGGKIIFAGNGASASIASHLANDFTKQGGVRSVTFHDPAFITAFSNDYGYEWWLAKALEFHMDANDLVVLISSSGKSPNIIKAAEFAKSKNVPVVAFTGFDRNNPLNLLSDVSFWVDSRAYNHVECVHMIWLTTVVDVVIGKAEYSVS
jgi:D-sedoheptulose 7-phosphate isomerase